MGKEAEVIEDRGDEVTPSESEVQTPETEAEAKEPEDEAKEPEAEAKEAEPEPAPPQPQGVRIPKFRYDAVAARAREAEERIAELEAQLQAQPQAAAQAAQPEAPEKDRMSEIDEQIAEAVKNADADRVTQLMAESRRLQMEQIRAEMDTTRTAAVSETQETLATNSILDQLELDFPEFNENSDAFNQEVNDKVVELQQGYMALGKSQSAALAEAVNIGIAMYGLKPRSQSEAAAPASRKTDVKKNISAANKQPPNLTDVGDDSDSAGQKGSSVDMNQLTEAEFDALPEETKRAKRGDFV